MQKVSGGIPKTYSEIDKQKVNAVCIVACVL